MALATAAGVNRSGTKSPPLLDFENPAEATETVGLGSNGGPKATAAKLSKPVTQLPGEETFEPGITATVNRSW